MPDLKYLPPSKSSQNNALKMMFGICMSLSITFGTYTATVFTLMTIYSKTALGMGLQSKYIEFFDSCATFRLWGFRSFLATLFTFNMGWLLSLVLNYEGEFRWWIALPALFVSIIGLAHYKMIISLAGSIIYS